ncbi:MAG: hypothetical protein AAF682_13950 [Planctomycetota bacterium]
MPRPTSFAALASLVLVAAPLSSQSSLVFCMDGDELTLDNADGLVEAGLIREDECAIVTPSVEAYSASAFLPMTAQWGFLGDADLDGELTDASTTGPGGDTDAVFVRRFPAPPSGPVGPRDVFVSKEGDAGFADDFEDGDVFRYASQGALEVFVREAQLLDALGQAPTADLDLDAICQTAGGDLFVSFADTESYAGGSASDGDVLHIPAASITYGADSNVAAIATGAAQVVASEADVNAWIAASLVQTSVGGSPSTSIDLTALELDPAGGSFESPQVPGLFLPNLLFAWSGFSNDGAVLSTAGGGTLAALNGVPLASDVATTGTQLGLAPDSTGLGGLMGMAVAPATAPPLAAENYPTSLITSSTILWSRQEVSGATPGGLVVFFVDVGPTGTGAVVPALALPGVGGELFGDGTVITLATQTAGGGGHVGNVVTLPASFVGTNQNLVFQAFDLGAFALSSPAPVQFL